MRWALNQMDKSILRQIHIKKIEEKNKKSRIHELILKVHIYYSVACIDIEQ